MYSWSASRMARETVTTPPVALKLSAHPEDELCWGQEKKDGKWREKNGEIMQKDSAPQSWRRQRGGGEANVNLHASSTSGLLWASMGVESEKETFPDNSVGLIKAWPTLDLDFKGWRLG